MTTVKARIRTGDVFKSGDTVSVIGSLQSNGQYRYEVRKPFPESIGYGQLSFYDGSRLLTVGLGIVGGCHRADSGLGAYWTRVRLLDVGAPETWERIRMLGFERHPRLGGAYVQRKEGNE